jgi:hypothetical protein
MQDKIIINYSYVPQDDNKFKIFGNDGKKPNAVTKK